MTIAELLAKVFGFIGECVSAVLNYDFIAGAYALANNFEALAPVLLVFLISILLGLLKPV